MRARDQLSEWRGQLLKSIPLGHQRNQDPLPPAYPKLQIKRTVGFEVRSEPWYEVKPQKSRLFDLSLVPGLRYLNRIIRRKSDTENNCEFYESISYGYICTCTYTGPEDDQAKPPKGAGLVKDFPGPSKSGPMNCFNVFRVELKSSSIKSTGTSTRMSDNDQDTIIEGSSPPGHPTSVADEPKLKYKSWKKKYRKMRLQFEQKMRESDQFFREEQQAIETTRRLAHENDQLLEILLDLNNSTQIPAHLRFDLGSPLSKPEPLEAAPKLEPPDDRKSSSSLSEDPSSKKRSSRSATKAKQQENQAAAAENNPTTTTTTQPDLARPKSFQALLASVPHTRLLSTAESHMADELCVDPPPPTYISPAQEEEYLASIDTALESNPPINPFLHPKPGSTDREKERELTLRNPVSVYNWLRRYQPQVFLQDNEGTPEKTGMKSSRGAGKRASAAAARNLLSEHQAQLSATMADLLDDNTIVADFPGNASINNTKSAGPTNSSSSKRKREKDDDPGYRPKGGSGGTTTTTGNGNAAPKRKRESEPGGGGAAAKKARRTTTTTAGGGMNGN